MNTLPFGLLAAVLLAGTLSPVAAGQVGAQLDCDDDELVALYPGYPGFRGYLPDTVGALDWVCSEELPRRFDPAEEDEDNERAADRLGIGGSTDDWTWENWMAIEAERGLGPTCYSCAIFNPPAFPPYEPPRRVDRDVDARYLLGTLESTNITYRWFMENDLPTGNMGDALFDYQIRAVAMMHAEGDHLNADQVLRFAEDYLECRYTAVGTPCSPRPANDQMCRSLIEHAGYAPTPDDAAYEDQLFTVVVGFWALQSLWPASTAGTESVLLERTLQDWEAERSRDRSTPGFGEWLQDNGGYALCP